MMASDLRQRNAWFLAFLLLTGCIFFGALFHMELQALLVALIVALLFSMQGKHAREGAPLLIVMLLVVQNLAIGLGAHIGGNMSADLSYLTQVPFVTCAVIFCSIAADRLDLPMLDNLNRWFWVLVLWCLVMFVIGHGASLSARLVTLRNLTCWFMAFCIARAFLTTREKRERFYKQFGWICVAVAILGFIGAGISFQGWLDMGLQEVYIAKRSPLENLTGWGGSGRFYTSIDGTHKVLRMLSTYYEPINLAYLFSAGLICIATAWKRSVLKAFALCVVAIGLVWSFGKGGWVVTGTVVAYLTLTAGIRRKGCSRQKLVRVLVAIFAFVAVVLIAYYLLIGGAVRPHFWAIERTWANVVSHPLGHGLGSGGNSAAAFGSLAGDWLSSGQESALMSFAYQVGIPGVLFLFFSLLAVSRTSVGIESSHRGALLLSLPFFLFGISLLQDNTFTPQCVVPFMLLLGAFSNEGEACDGPTANGRRILGEWGVADERES